MDLRLGDCLDVMRTLPANSIDAIVCDPPYGLGFMGKAWDALPPGREWAEEVLRVAKPGAHLIAFGGQRTIHRLATAIEDGGFDIRDQIGWVYWSGFPKSLDVSKAIDSRKDWKALEALQGAVRAARTSAGLSQSEVARRIGLIGDDENLGGGGYMWFETGRKIPTRDEWTELKRALGLPNDLDDAFEAAEREVIGTAEFANQEAYGGGFSGTQTITAPATDAAREWSGWGTALKPAIEPAVLARKPLSGTVAANIMRHRTGALNIDGCRYALGDPAWPGPHGEAPTTHTSSVYGGQDGQVYGKYGAIEQERQSAGQALGRWPANLYACAKASRAERERGCDGLPARAGHDAVEREEGSAGAANPRAGAGRTAEHVRNFHPTVKPVALMRWLCRLVCPPGGIVLDPFMGSGTTGIAAVLEGFSFIGVEREPDFHRIAQARIAYAAGGSWADAPQIEAATAPVQTDLLFARRSA